MAGSGRSWANHSNSVKLPGVHKRATRPRRQRCRGRAVGMAVDLLAARSPAQVKADGFTVRRWTFPPMYLHPLDVADLQRRCQRVHVRTGRTRTCCDNLVTTLTARSELWHTVSVLGGLPPQNQRFAHAMLNIRITERVRDSCRIGSPRPERRGLRRTQIAGAPAASTLERGDNSSGGLRPLSEVRRASGMGEVAEQSSELFDL
jgi:hypothetical protein